MSEHAENNEHQPAPTVGGADATAAPVGRERTGPAENLPALAENRPAPDAPLLEVDGLTVRYEPKLHPALDAVQDVSFSIRPGEFVGLIGESGSGKSTLGTALLRLTEKPGRITGGTIRFDGRDITAMSQEELRPYRWRDISTVFQSSMNSLNPVVRVEDQFRDAIELHSSRRGAEVVERIKELFDLVLIDHRFIRAYPHELSGGMKQRVNLALALVNDPKFVLLDEPTTGLDVVVQRSILEGVRKLQAEQGFAVLFISHDIGTVMDLSDRILVMYAGRIVEEHDTDDLLREPLHPYTKGLLGSYGDPRQETVRITYVPGRPPDLSQPLTGCPFAPRCPEKIAQCLTDAPQLLEMPALRTDDAVTGLRLDSHGTWAPPRAACHVARLQREAPETKGLPPRTVRFAGPAFEKTVADTKEALRGEVFLEVDGVTKVFQSRQGLRTRETLAVDDVSFQLRRGMVTALVGQSGSGKSTLARMITGVDRPTKGTITFHAKEGPLDVGTLGGGGLRGYRSLVQMVFQDPYSSLNPNKTLEYILSRPLKNHRSMGRAELSAAIDELLERVALTPARRYRSRHAFELSGGQRQRVVIARALAADPELIIADEPISSLDVSIRAEVLELLQRLVADSDVGILYITHDLLSARMLADDVIVLNKGRVVEHGEAIDVIRTPRDEYTRRLLEAIPNPFADLYKP
ncbi:ABC transporter ATP-binding protein [Brachybacterium sp. J153]|uniref:ABC transporter ATP-binding protein n=1 Tax=Brachybacterium sp. J153 TaxID=3116488 RepID=UPI002E785E65|nr:ABC transporter ATP-binding protein [Brachybacterium sp. J153]MEE1618593.1 ABC transporter ATP-binding protein [Brachybacterium sp. J153]